MDKSRWDDTIGLYDYNARFYDPQLGQFIQPDSLVAQPYHPIAWNRYAYVYNSPVNYTDSSGHFIDALWDIVDLGVNVQNCLGDSDALSCYMVPVAAAAVVVPFLTTGGFGDNAVKAVARSARDRLWAQKWWQTVWIWGHPNVWKAEISEAGFVERVFKGDWDLYDKFLRTLDEELPEGMTVYAKGSSVTKYKWTTGALFDSRGPGTSDLDLVLAGENALGLWKPPYDNAGHFKFLGRSTGILGAETPGGRLGEVAPALIPLYQKLEAMVGRPVNFQGASEGYLRRRLWLQRTKYLELLRK